MSMFIGKILEKTNTNEIQFVSRSHFKGSFVEIKMEHLNTEARIIAEITSKEVVNPYFERPSTINYLKEEDESIKNYSLYLVKAKPLALFNDGKIEEVNFPPLPGSNVFEAQDSDILKALRLPSEGMEIGVLKGHNLPLKISYIDCFKTHISIVGQTGSGKSYFAAKLALELVKIKQKVKNPKDIAIPIIFDTSGEYSKDYIIPSDHSQVGLILSAITIGEHHFPILNESHLWLLNEIYEIDYKLENEILKLLNGQAQKELENDLNKKQQVGIFETSSLKDLEEISTSKISSTKQLANVLEKYISLHNKLNPKDNITPPYGVLSKLRKINLKIKKSDDIDFVHELSNGIVVDLSKQDDLIERQIAIKLFLYEILEAARLKKLNRRLVIFLDEAHNYVPSVYNSLCKDEILRVAREGRKYGLTLCLISQRPRWVDPTALSQCGNVFIFRIQNSDDQKHIFNSASLPDSIQKINIARLETGEMLIAGDVVYNPLICSVSDIDLSFIPGERKRLKENILNRPGA